MGYFLSTVRDEGKQKENRPSALESVRFMGLRHRSADVISQQIAPLSSTLWKELIPGQGTTAVCLVAWEPTHLGERRRMLLMYPEKRNKEVLRFHFKVPSYFASLRP